MARLGVPVGGRVKNLRAVEDQSAPIPREITSRLGGSIYIVGRIQSETSLFAHYDITDTPLFVRLTGFSTVP
jgi:hypothetical protein